MTVRGVARRLCYGAEATIATFIPVKDLMPAALTELLRKAPLSPEKVAFAWRSAVGPAVDQATTIALHEGVLRVHAKGSPWKREIERSSGVVVARLNALLGAGVVRVMKITAR